MRRSARLSSRTLAAGAALGSVVSLTLLTAGCDAGGARSPAAGDHPPGHSTSEPSASSVAMTGATGAALRVGKPAVVAFPGSSRPERVRVTVERVRPGERKDLKAFRVPPRLDRARPWYAKLSVRDLGPLGPRFNHLPRLVAHVNAGRDLPPAVVRGRFGRCRVERFPSAEGGEPAERRIEPCLTYLVPRQLSLRALELRVDPREAPLRWEVNRHR